MTGSSLGSSLGSAPGSSQHAAPQTGGVRFAPSPTGRFHIGNLRTAWISHRFSRALGVPWVVRFEDIDEPRVLAGALGLQLSDMAALGMKPDIELLQSSFRTRHLSLLECARASGAIYPCTCSRREVQTALAGLASAPHDGVAPVYSGQCRHQARDPGEGAAPGAGVAWRFKMPDESGRQDFIVARTATATDTDGFIPAYHWACAIDDFDGRYDLIVRSSDLSAALPLQRAIQKWLASSEGKSVHFARAFHTSLITQDDGHRLEKRTAGVTLHELLQDGWSEAKLLEAFERSFDSRHLQERADVGLELSQNLRISDLLTKSG